MTYVTISAFYSAGFDGTAFDVLPFTSQLSRRFCRAVSAIASFILFLFIYWKSHVNDNQKRSLIFEGQMDAHFFSHSFCFHPISARMASPPLNHSIDIKMLRDF